MIKIWSTKTRECLHTFKPHPIDGETSALFDIVLDSEKEEQMFACTFGGEIVALRVNLERRTHLEGLRVSELKSMLRQGGTPFDDCLYKSDLVNR